MRRIVANSFVKYYIRQQSTGRFKWRINARIIPATIYGSGLSGFRLFQVLAVNVVPSYNNGYLVKTR
jgi:hypothetical protein